VFEATHPPAPAKINTGAKANNPVVLRI